MYGNNTESLDRKADPRASILGPSVFPHYNSRSRPEDMSRLSIYRYLSGRVRDGRAYAGTMTEVPVGRAVGRWILNRLSDGAGNRLSAWENFAVIWRSRSVCGSSLVIYAITCLSLSLGSWYATGSRRKRRSWLKTVGQSRGFEQNYDSPPD